MGLKTFNDITMPDFHPEKMWADTVETYQLDKDKMTENEYTERKSMFMAGMAVTFAYSQALATHKFTQEQFSQIMNLWSDEIQKFWMRRLGFHINKLKP